MKDDADPHVVPEYTQQPPSEWGDEEGTQKYALSEKRKIGITGAVFLILNKMIGTGSKSELASHTPLNQRL